MGTESHHIYIIHIEKIHAAIYKEGVNWSINQLSTDNNLMRMSLLTKVMVSTIFLDVTKWVEGSVSLVIIPYESITIDHCLQVKPNNTLEASNEYSDS